MTCKSIRHQILTDPYQLSRDVEKHLAHCAGCRSYHASVHHNDGMLRNIFARVQQEGLHERLLAERTFQPSRRRFVLGVAASLAVGGFVTANYFSRPQARSAEDWVAAMLNHLQHDPQHTYARDPDASTELTGALASLGGRQIAPVPTILRAGMCSLAGTKAAHVVFEVKDERAIAFVVEQQVKPSAFRIAEWCIQLHPISGGTVAVFASNEDCAQRLSVALSRAIEFRVG